MLPLILGEPHPDRDGRTLAVGFLDDGTAFDIYSRLETNSLAQPGGATRHRNRHPVDPAREPLIPQIAKPIVSAV
jgi:hypothetical protein